MLKYFEIMYVKGQGNLQTQQLMSIQTVLDQVFINNCQPSKALKFSSQSSKLEKKITINRQSYHPIETLTVLLNYEILQSFVEICLKLICKFKFINIDNFRAIIFMRFCNGCL